MYIVCIVLTIVHTEGIQMQAVGHYLLSRFDPVLFRNKCYAHTKSRQTPEIITLSNESLSGDEDGLNSHNHDGESMVMNGMGGIGGMQSAWIHQQEGGKSPEHVPESHWGVGVDRLMHGGNLGYGSGN